MDKDIRQEFLNRLLMQQMKNVKLKCFKYKHSPLLLNKIIIREADLKKYEAGGMYEQIYKNKNNPFKFTHKILIEKSYLDDYFNYKRDRKDWLSKYYNKTYYKKLIKRTILHELCHAFVYEEWEGFSDIKGTTKDASPIFLSVLNWLGGDSEHHAAICFENTKIYNDVMKIETYRKLQHYIIRLIREYEDAADELKEITNINKGEKYGSMIGNTFEFADRSAGLKANYIIMDKICSKYSVLNLKVCSYQIGSTINPEEIKKLVNRKMGNENFKDIEKERHYVLSNKKVIEITDKKIKERK